MTTWKIIAWIRQTFIGKVMSLFLYILSRLVIAFLPRSKCHVILCCSQNLQWFWSQESKVSHCFHCFSIYMPWKDGTRCHDLRFWMLSCKPVCFFCCCCFVSQFFHSPVSLSSRGLFSPSSLSAIWVLSSVYLRLFLFPPAILIQACASSSLAFHMMCSASNLNKQGYNSEPVHCCMVLESVSILKFFVSLSCLSLLLPHYEQTDRPFGDLRQHIELV